MTIDDLIARPLVITLLVEKLQRSERHVAERVLKRHDFPKPKRQVGRSVLYNRADIEKFLLGK